MLSQKHFHLVYWSRPRDDGSMDRRLLGKIMIHDGRAALVSDYHGFLSKFPHEAPIDAQLQRRLDRLFNSSYVDVVSKADLANGLRPDLIAETKLPLKPANGGQVQPDPRALLASAQVSQPPSVFEYRRVGMDQSHTVEITAGKVLLDGTELGDEEARKVLDNVQRGVATLRYKKMDLSPLQKFEQMLIGLHKAEGLANSMDALKALVAAGHLPQEHFDNIRRELYADEMVPSLGNKRAFHEHLLNEGRGGVHIMLDANDFKSINDDLSHEHGDAAIKSMGEALRSAVDKTVGPEQAKVHRFGGDEFHVHVPSHEHAAMFLRSLREHLEAVPPVGGTHKLSMSAGIGPDHKTADKALNEGAKGQKKAAVAALGGDPNERAGKIRAPHALYAHSAMPGLEGPVPTGHDQLPLKEPSVPKVTPLHAPEAPKPEAPKAPEMPKAPGLSPALTSPH
jgi:diguanylate cyclase (GGDEF)-like protein